jgi:AraC family transcriptional regulator
MGNFMKQKKLVVDYNKTDTCELILSSAPILASEKARFQVHQYSLSPHDAPMHVPLQHVIVTYNDSEPLFLKRDLAGISKDEEVKYGDIMVSPAQVEHGAHWDRPVDLTFLLFDPKKISQFAWEYVDPDEVELLPCFAQSDPVLSNVSQALLSQLGNQAYIDSAGGFLAHHLLQNYCCGSIKLDLKKTALTKYQLSQAKEYIFHHIDQPIHLADLANLLSMSDFYFSRSFKDSTGLNFSQFLIQQRLQKAVDLLANTDFNLKTVSELSGFSTQSHFSDTFQRYFKISPSQYRKKL